jgi:MATE family multidrug resistance protein
MVPLANLVSAIFLGHLSEIHHLTGVALAGNILNFLYFTLLFLRMGTTGVTAQAVGQDDREGVLLVGLRNGLLALPLGIVIIVLQYPLGELVFSTLSIEPEVLASAKAYFHNQIWGAPAILLNFVLLGWFLGQEKNTLVVSLSVGGNLTKIAFDYLFIIYLGWASAGAGISYAISQYISLLVGFIFLLKIVQWQEIKALAGKILDLNAMCSSLTLNGDIFVGNLAMFSAALLFNYEGAQLGTIIYTQNALLLQIFNFSLYLVPGVGFGTETLVGNIQGKGLKEQLKPLGEVSVIVAVLIGLFFGGMSCLFPDAVFSLLTDHAEVIEGINIFVPWLLLVLIFGSISFTLNGYFLGLAQGVILRNSSLIALVGFLPTLIVAVKFESNHILWLALLFLDAINAIILGVQMPKTWLTEESSLPMAE